LYAAVDADDPDHTAAQRTLTRWVGELVVSAFTATEADHLVLTRLGVDVELHFLDDLSQTFLLDGLDAAGVAEAAALCRRYRDLELGLADASIVLLARKWRTRSLATLDERHFRAIEPLQGGVFELLPVDAG
jgi:predicted nucleic acid-binding protein